MTDLDSAIESNMGLVRNVVKKYLKVQHTDTEDLLQEGRIALWRAIQKHRPEQSAFGTFATRVVFNHLCNYCKKRHSHRVLQITRMRRVQYVEIITEQEE